MSDLRVFKLSRESLQKLKDTGEVEIKGVKHFPIPGGLYTDTMFMPTRVSDLELDVNFAKIKLKTVSELPTYGLENIFYLVPNGEYKEVFIYSNEQWVSLGTTEAHLDGYLKSNEVYDWAKQPEKPKYTINEISGALGKIPDYYLTKNGDGQVVVTEINFKKGLKFGSKSCSLNSTNEGISISNGDNSLKINENGAEINGNKVLTSCESQKIFEGVLGEEQIELEIAPHYLVYVKGFVNQIIGNNQEVNVSLPTIIVDGSIKFRNLNIKVIDNNISGKIYTIENSEITESNIGDVIIYSLLF